MLPSRWIESVSLHSTCFTYQSSGVEYSTGLCEMPSLQGMKIMPVGQCRAVEQLHE